MALVPPELITCIIDYIDEADVTSLHSLIFASPLTRSAAESILYRTFQVSTSLSNARQYARSYLKCLTQRPFLAGYILCFRLSDYGSAFMDVDEMEGLFDILETILRLAINLRNISVGGLEGHARLYQLLGSVSATVRGISYETRHPQPQADFEAILCTLASNPRLRPTFLSLRSHGHMDDDFVNMSFLPIIRASDTNLRRLLQFVASLEGTEYVVHRLLPSCSQKFTKLQLYIHDMDVPNGGPPFEGQNGAETECTSIETHESYTQSDVVTQPQRYDVIDALRSLVARLRRCSSMRLRTLLPVTVYGQDQESSWHLTI